MRPLKREPFWGPNAKPFLIQKAVGLAVAGTLYALGFWHFLYDLGGQLLAMLPP